MQVFAFVLHQLALEPVGKFETLDKGFAWVPVLCVDLTFNIALTVIRVAWIVDAALVVERSSRASKPRGWKSKAPSPTASAV